MEHAGARVGALISDGDGTWRSAGICRLGVAQRGQSGEACSRLVTWLCTRLAVQATLRASVVAIITAQSNHQYWTPMKGTSPMTKQ